MNLLTEKVGNKQQQQQQQQEQQEVEHISSAISTLISGTVITLIVHVQFVIGSALLIERHRRQRITWSTVNGGPMETTETEEEELRAKSGSSFTVFCRHFHFFFVLVEILGSFYLERVKMVKLSHVFFLRSILFAPFRERPASAFQPFGTRISTFFFFIFLLVPCCCSFRQLLSDLFLLF